MEKPRIYTIPFASVYPLYIAKAEKKGHTKAEVDELVAWLTGYTPEAMAAHIQKGTSLEEFFADAPLLNPHRALIRGVICGVHVEEITDPTTQEIRYLDKIIDELAKGKPLSKIKRH